MRTSIIDIHCHPTLKSFGKSFSLDTPGEQSPRKGDENSLWYYRRPTHWNKFVQRLAGLTRFSQSNLTACAYGNVHILFASLYSIERDFVNLTIGHGPLADFAANLVSCLGRKRIDFLQANTDYFADMEMEYRFMEQMHDHVISLPEGKHRYHLVKNFNELQNDLQQDDDDDITTIYVIMTIEGMHNLNTGTGLPVNEANVLSNLRRMKGWGYAPFFVTFAHHFYNELCGHAESLSDFLQDLLTRQERGMNTGFTNLGWRVLDELLSTENGRRVHIDIKHMSALAREQYYQHLATSYASEYAEKKIPIIISHGACNGFQNRHDHSYTPGLEETAARMYAADINFYDDEIVLVAKSGGIIGLQLDERRISSKRYKRSLRLELASANQRKHSNSKMLWNNIQHIVQLLDKQNLFAWDCIAIGSDFDGVIDPINMFWTEEDMDDLTQFIERHAYDFLNEYGSKFQNPANNITAAEAIDRVFYANAYEFMRKYFK